MVGSHFNQVDVSCSLFKLEIYSLINWMTLNLIMKSPFFNLNFIQLEVIFWSIFRRYFKDTRHFDYPIGCYWISWIYGQFRWIWVGHRWRRWRWRPAARRTWHVVRNVKAQKPTIGFCLSVKSAGSTAVCATTQFTVYPITRSASNLDRRIPMPIPIRSRSQSSTGETWRQKLDSQSSKTICQWRRLNKHRPLFVFHFTGFHWLRQTVKRPLKKNELHSFAFISPTISEPIYQIEILIVVLSIGRGYQWLLLCFGWS